MTDEERDVMYCPNCGHDGAFDGRGSFPHHYSEYGMGETQDIVKLQHNQTWYKYGCGECGEEFARMIDEEVLKG